LKEEEVISPEVVLEKVEECGQLPNFEEHAFRENLDKNKIADLYLIGKTLSQTRVEYHLSNGIVIKGTWVAVENLVQVKSLDGGGFEFTIQSPKFEKKYV